MVRALIPDLSANSSIDQFNAALPARICAPTIIDRSRSLSYKLTMWSHKATTSSDLRLLPQGENPVRIGLNELIGGVPPMKPDRHRFIGGSDARIIMSGDENALLRLWKEKRGEAEPEDFGDNLVVQLGVAT